MILRDEITTSDRLLKLIDFEKNIDEKQNKIKSLMKDTEEGVQRYKLTNDEVIANTKRTIKVSTEKVLVATYTAGYPIEDFKEEYIDFVNSLLPVWQSNSGYLQMVRALSIGILLEIDEEIFDQLVGLVKKDDPEDYLIDYLIQFRHPDWQIRINYNFPRPYGFTRKIIEEENSEKAVALLIKGLDYKQLEEFPYFPYDLVAEGGTKNNSCDV